MRLIKNLIFSIVTTIALIWIWYCADFRYTGITIPWDNTPVDIDFSTMIKENIQDEDDNKNWLNRLLNLFMPNRAMYDEGNWPSVLFYLKTIINYLLWFVSLIALILMIYAFYMIFFKKDEAGVTSAKQIIKWVVIALLIIWLSRVIVSFLFRFEKENTQDIWYNDNIQIHSNIG